MNPFQEFIWNFFNEKETLVVGAWAGLPLTIIFIVILVQRRNRDERGWKIIGKSSVISFTYFLIIANVIAKTVGSQTFPSELNYLFYPFSARRLRPLRSGMNCVRITLDKVAENTIIKSVEKLQKTDKL